MSPISSAPPPNETSLLAIQMEESGERRTFYVFNKPIQSSHLKLGSLTTSMVEPLADDNISMATRRNKKRIEPYQPPERLLDKYKVEEKQSEKYVIEVQYTPKFSGRASLFDIFTVTGEKRNGSKVRIEGKHPRRIKLSRTNHEKALEDLLTESSAQKWLRAYLFASIWYYYLDMVKGSGPQVYIITGLQYLSIDSNKTTRAVHTSRSTKLTVKDPTQHIPGKIAEFEMGRENDPQDHSTQEATGGYSGEYICAAQFRKLELNFQLKDLELPAIISLAGLTDLTHGICGPHTPLEGESQIEKVGIFLDSTESDESKAESCDEYISATDPEDYGEIDWKKIRTKMGVLG